MKVGKVSVIAARMGRRTISAIRYGMLLVWSAIRSCFGSGKWIGDKPWVGDEKWKGTYK